MVVKQLFPFPPVHLWETSVVENRSLNIKIWMSVR